ncbi:hypothetical protein EVA_04118 [gut metagenome]|uniref:Uncharacterized protein n=1 Tax=gut metagenome TaxID=749906 RepID=J9GKC0_9ZZZZ
MERSLVIVNVPGKPIKALIGQLACSPSNWPLATKPRTLPLS